jgi:hypothetical protein
MGGEMSQAFIFGGSYFGGLPPLPYPVQLAPVNTVDYTAFLRLQGFTTTVLPDNSPAIPFSLTIASEVTNDWFNSFSPFIYVIMVYNLATDRLVNFAPDQVGPPPQTFFADLRKSLGLTTFSPGFLTSSSDAGTSQSRQLIDAAKTMTLADLQMLKTPWGQTYLGYAQQAGSTIWGLS